LVVREGRGFQPATSHYHPPHAVHCKQLPTWDLGYSFGDHSNPRSPIGRELGRRNCRQCATHIHSLISAIFGTPYDPLADSSRPNATGMCLVASPCRTTTHSLTSMGLLRMARSCRSSWVFGFKSRRSDLKHDSSSRSIVTGCFSLVDNGLRWKPRSRSRFNSTSEMKAFRLAFSAT
jgi:hypothetical protein